MALVTVSRESTRTTSSCRRSFGDVLSKSRLITSLTRSTSKQAHGFFCAFFPGSAGNVNSLSWWRIGICSFISLMAWRIRFSAGSTDKPTAWKRIALRSRHCEKERLTFEIICSPSSFESWRKSLTYRFSLPVQNLLAADARQTRVYGLLLP